MTFYSNISWGLKKITLKHISRDATNSCEIRFEVAQTTNACARLRLSAL